MNGTILNLALAAVLGVGPTTPATAPTPGTELAEPREGRQEPIRVVTTLPVYASIVEAVGGDHVEVRSIADPNEDAHFVRPKPSFALNLRRADMFVTTGLDLELWVPTLLDKANNPRVLEGGQGYVTAYTGIELLDIPASADRSSGDVHIYGNPHLHTDPLRTLQVARNITTGLKRVAPERAADFDRGLQDFSEEVWERLFGERLIEILQGPALEKLAQSENFFSFLRTNEYEGRALIDYLGGWLGQAEVLRGQEIICYHKNWAYLEDRFGLRCAAYVESKPGIPPTPRHVAELIDMMRGGDYPVLLAANHFDRSKVVSVAERGGAVPVIVPLYPGASEEVEDYVDVVDVWVERLVDAVERSTR